MIVDVEETCLRCRLEVTAIVNNSGGESFAIQAEKIITLVEVTTELLQRSISIPLFTPGHRKFALNQVLTLGGKRFPPLVDPTAILPSSLKLSEGVYINSGVTIGGMTSLGPFAFINRSASLGHHFCAEDFVSIGPGVVTGGNVLIGRGSVIGTGATILPGVRIGSNAVVAAGAVVTRDVQDNTLVMGTPARVVRENIKGYNDVSI